MTGEPSPIHRGAQRAISGKALAAVAVWGMSFVATRVALDSLNPFGLVLLRLAGGTAILAALLRAGGGPLLPRLDDLPRCTFIGCVVGAHLLIQAYGLQYTSAINTGWIISFIPVTIALAAQLFLKQRLAAIGWGGVIIATSGVLLVTMSSPPDFARGTFGDMLQLTSCLTWTVYTLVGAGLVARNGALRVTTFAMGVAAAIVAACVLFAGMSNGPMTWRAGAATAFLVFFCSGLPYYLWFQGQHEHGPTRVGALLYFEPFFTLAAAVAFIGETVTPNAITGGAVVLVGVWLVGRGSRGAAG